VEDNMTNENKRIGEALRARLQVECARKGWSLSELARQLQKTPQGLQDVLRRGNPKAETLTQIADALGVSVAKLYRPVTPEEYGLVFMPRPRRGARPAAPAVPATV
jgi:lambda repressor-like predicted transcriptional regulator